MTNSFYHTRLDGCTAVQYTEAAPTDAVVIQTLCHTFRLWFQECSVQVYYTDFQIDFLS